MAAAALVGAVIPRHAPGAQEVSVKKASAADAATLEPALPTVGLPDPPPLAEPPAPDFPATHHPWARFQLGAWRTLRTTTESFDPAGKFVGRSETTQTDTIVRIGEQGYTIETQTIVDVGGKRLRGAVRQTKFHLLADVEDTLVEASDLPPANLNVDGRLISCRRWQLTCGAGPERRIETVYYSPDLSPYILRRETSAADGTGESDLVTATTTVTRVDTPVAIGEQLVPGCEVSVTSQSGTVRIVRSEIRSDVVPGGLVSATSTERDPAGKRMRWSTVDLVEYGEAGEAPAPRPRWRLFRRRRN